MDKLPSVPAADVPSRAPRQRYAAVYEDMEGLPVGRATPWVFEDVDAAHLAWVGVVSWLRRNGRLGEFDVSRRGEVLYVARVRGVDDE